MANRKKVEKLKRKRPQTNSSVSKKILAFWESKFVWGDYTKIQDATSLSRPTIKSAFDGRATDDVIQKITNFYLTQKDNGKG